VNDSYPTAADVPTRICPRCGAEVVEVFYGPCTDCRADLRAKLGGRAGSDVVVESADRVHRTPNFVATKD
jgi:hypothetical protein